MFEIWIRSNNQAEWTLYGTFASEADFAREIPNVQWLGLATKRVRIR